MQIATKKITDADYPFEMVIRVENKEDHDLLSIMTMNEQTHAKALQRALMLSDETTRGIAKRTRMINQALFNHEKTI